MDLDSVALEFVVPRRVPVDVIDSINQLNLTGGKEQIHMQRMTRKIKIPNVGI